MPVKKTVSAKKPAVKSAAKAKPAKKVAKGDSYVCGVCGLAVTVEQVGNIVYTEESPILCCGKLMKTKTKAGAKAAK